MKIKVVVIFTFLILSDFAFAQQNKWPYIDYAYAKAFMYNLEFNSSGSYAILQDGNICNSVTSDGENLTKVELTGLISLINSDIKGLNMGLSKTFIPHHAIVFYDKNNVPCASIMLSFDGEALRLNPEKKETKLGKELTECEMADQLNKLSQIKGIIESHGFPVLNSPLEYQKLVHRQTRSLGMPKFDLKSKNAIKQLDSYDNKRFDLSGIVQVEGNVFVIADKEWNKYIYRLDTSLNNFTISGYQQFNFDGIPDIEGIEYSNDKFYLIDESGNDVYSIKKNESRLEKLKIPWENYDVDRSDWGNKGFEGIAIDGQNQILYLAKEREPRRIFRIDLRTMEMSEPFINALKIGGGHDISDLKYENGFLYILERGLGLITRINCRTGERMSFSFQDLVYKWGQRIYKNDNPEFGMAEALLLTPDEMWIGFDNNGDPVSDYGKSLGLKEGNKCSIIIFKRPKGF